MSKVAVVWSSPNTDGLTASAKKQFIKGLTKAGAEIEEIHLTIEEAGKTYANTLETGFDMYY